MYVPIGFPHTTDTLMATRHETIPPTITTTTSPTDEKTSTHNSTTPQHVVFDETSIHLTMGHDTHVKALAYAHLRWSLYQRVCKDFQMEIPTDKLFWEAMDTMPIGFLSRE